MRKLLFVLILFTSAAAIAYPQAPVKSAGPDETATAQKAAQVDALMAQLSRGNSPGAAVTVIRKDEVLLEKGYGLANLKSATPIGPSTIFNIASVAKQFTAMAVMILAERGKLNYSDPVSKYFPDFPAYGREITIRQMLDHTSGLADYTVFWKEGQRSDQGSAKHTSEGVLQFLASLKTTDFTPGEKWRYSNSGYVILSIIVSKVSGMPFPQFLNENIFAPVGMKDSSACGIPAGPNRATGYMQSGAGFKETGGNPNNFICGDGGIYSTVADLGRWNQALDTGKLVKASTLSEAFTTGALTDGTKFNYGFGWGVGKYAGLDFVSHSGGVDGFVAHILRFRGKDLVVILASNFEQLAPPSYTLANKIAAIYLSAEIPARDPIKTGARLSEDYAGTYEFFTIGIKVTIENNELLLEAKGKKVKLVAAGNDEFVAGDGEENYYKFMRNSKDQVTGLSLLSVNGLFLTKKL